VTASAHSSAGPMRADHRAGRWGQRIAACASSTPPRGGRAPHGRGRVERPRRLGGATL